MTIEPISNGNLRIWLTEEETEEWGLSDSRPDKVRRLVRRALSAAGRNPTARAWAEMIPVEGGFVLLVTTAVHRHAQPAVYALEEAALAQVVARLRLSPEETAQVYGMEEGYGVVLYGEGEAADALLCEYGTPLGCGSGMAAHIAEYGRWLFTMPVPEPPEREGRAH